MTPARRSRGPSLVIDCFPSSVARHISNRAIVAIDVIRATTLAVTAVAQDRPCLIASSASDALMMRERLPNAIVAGELGGEMPLGFDTNNSPADLVADPDTQRPLVMLSTSGTRLMLDAQESPFGAFVACLRNLSATASAVVSTGLDVALIGAGSRGEFREEDQMCCAWIAERMVAAGYVADDEAARIIARWRDATPTVIASGNSVAYLRRSGQLRDYHFIVDHIDDLSFACTISGGEVAAQVGRSIVEHSA